MVPGLHSLATEQPLKVNNKGFKVVSCNSKKCLGCNPNPPDLSPTMIKKLGTSFCQIDENILTEIFLIEKILKPIKKKSNKLNKSKNKLEKSKKSEENDDSTILQDEDGADSSTPEGSVPKKNSKK
jgi:hypothetical protein